MPNAARRSKALQTKRSGVGRTAGRGTAGAAPEEAAKKEEQRFYLKPTTPQACQWFRSSFHRNDGHRQRLRCVEHRLHRVYPVTADELARCHERAQQDPDIAFGYFSEHRRDGEDIVLRPMRPSVALQAAKAARSLVLA